MTQTTMIRAIVVALGMLIVAVTLFVLHAIVRYLVLYPMYHLRDVSDAITHGDTNQRAAIETEDEFRELADAFNRMLRHLTETQDQIQEVNKELDARVDQLAQLNLQLYEANRLKSDFLANMSHELRTPLNSIIGFSEVLQGIESLTDKQRRYASNIQKSGRLLLEMINDILDLAKVEAGKMEVKCSEFDLGQTGFGPVRHDPFAVGGQEHFAVGGSARGLAPGLPGSEQAGPDPQQLCSATRSSSRPKVA